MKVKITIIVSLNKLVCYDTFLNNDHLISDINFETVIREYFATVVRVNDVRTNSQEKNK